MLRQALLALMVLGLCTQIRASYIVNGHLCKYHFTKVKEHAQEEPQAEMSHVMRKHVYAINANNKGADQPAHPRSPISAFVVRCLDSIMSLVSISEISSL